MLWCALTDPAVTGIMLGAFCISESSSRQLRAGHKYKQTNTQCSSQKTWQALSKYKNDLMIQCKKFHMSKRTPTSPAGHRTCKNSPISMYQIGTQLSINIITTTTLLQVNCKAWVHQLQSQNLVKFIQGLFILIENHRILFVVFNVNWEPYNSIHLPQCELKIIESYSTGQVYSGFIHMNWKWSLMWIENHIIPLFILNGNWKSHNFIHLLQCEWKN